MKNEKENVKHAPHKLRKKKILNTSLMFTTVYDQGLNIQIYELPFILLFNI